MASLQCPECGKELVGGNAVSNKDPCICSQCGRKVYGRKISTNMDCPKCGKVHKADVVV